MVQTYVLDRIPSAKLRTFVVWGPMQEKETRADAETATAFQADLRATHFWTPEHAVAERFRSVAGLPEGERAWDTFLLYPAHVRWIDAEPPEPVTVLHVDKPLPKERRLNGERLHSLTLPLVEAAEAPVPQARAPDAVAVPPGDPS